MYKVTIAVAAVALLANLSAIRPSSAADKSHDGHGDQAKEMSKEGGKEPAKDGAKDGNKQTSKDGLKSAVKDSPKLVGKDPSDGQLSSKDSGDASSARLDDFRQKLAAAIARRRSGSGGPDQAGHDTLSLKVRSSDSYVSHGASRTPVRRAHAPSSSVPMPLAALGSSNGGAAAHGAGHDDLLTPHWSYDGDGGPAQWGRLKPEFAKCTSGSRQSPIDIRDGVKVELEPIKFSYQPSGFSVIDNGHTVQVNVGPGNTINVLGRRFELLQFHFHRPSEERINGRRFDMVAHLVHKDGDGRLAVIAVLLERGAAQEVIQNVWNNLPLERNEEIVGAKAIDLNALLPTDRSYFTYMGSLTTPPCSEGVLWMVLRQPVPLSNEQIGIFSRLYPMNARPLQSVSGRLIKESN